MSRKNINTASAPAAIGTYSQAVKVDNTVYISGQIALNPETMELVNDGIEEQIIQVFNNLDAVAGAAGGSLADIVKLTIYLINLDHFTLVNEIMAKYFQNPYPARVVVGVSQLPRDSLIEIDAVMVLPEN